MWVAIHGIDGVRRMVVRKGLMFEDGRDGRGSKLLTSVGENYKVR